MKRVDENGGEGHPSLAKRIRGTAAEAENEQGVNGNPAPVQGRGRAGNSRRVAFTPEDRKRQREERLDLVVSRPVQAGGIRNTKQGSSGRPVDLIANYFPLNKRTDWGLYHYHVDFAPDDIETREKKKLLQPHQQVIGAYIFDGSALYVSNRITPDPLELVSIREGSQEHVVISVRLVAQLSPTDVMFLHFFNIVLRNCMDLTDLDQIGRHYYDRHQAIRTHGLELWPGLKTAMRYHENGVLLKVEVTHKVLRTDTVLNVMNILKSMSDGRDVQLAIKNELIGSIVMTHYNRKTYRVDDIDWNTTPAMTFDMRGTQVSFAEYFRDRYSLIVTDMTQPMLVSRPKKRDFHRGMTGPILLVPEFCQMTGLTDEMRSNFQLMRAVSGHLNVAPEQRVQMIKSFMTRLNAAPGVKEELDRWGLQFNQNMVRLRGRVAPPEEILFGDGRKEMASANGDWTNVSRGLPMKSTIDLKNWILIVPSRENGIDNMIAAMKRVSGPMRFRLSDPKQIYRISDVRPGRYQSTIQQAMADHKGNIQLIFVVLPRQVVDTYAAIKKMCSVEYGVLSQCFVAKNANNPQRLMSICTKVAVQMNAKLGGEPWCLSSMPLKNMMIVGFDVYHSGKGKGQSVGALVASIDPETQARYYSTCSFHKSRDELSENLCVDMTKCLYAYRKRNNQLPARIIMYRDGVGDGQLSFVYNTELVQLKTAMELLYKAEGLSMPKFTFVVVCKKIDTRFFLKAPRGAFGNPDVGTIVDDVVTLIERYDFYLVSQTARTGTVSPTSYHVLYDTQGINADKMQRFTYKLCHLYFNWSGTVSVPAPCQYAHKLAHLTGVALKGDKASETLSDKLHFL